MKCSCFLNILPLFKYKLNINKSPLRIQLVEIHTYTQHKETLSTLTGTRYCTIRPTLSISLPNKRNEENHKIFKTLLRNVLFHRSGL